MKERKLRILTQIFLTPKPVLSFNIAYSVSNNLYFEDEKHKSPKSQHMTPPYLLALLCWIDYLNSLFLSLFISKMGI